MACLLGVIAVLVVATSCVTGAPDGVPALPSPGWTATISSNYSSVGHTGSGAVSEQYNHTARLSQLLHFDTVNKRLRVDYNVYPNQDKNITVIAVETPTGKLNVTLAHGCGLMWKLLPIGFPQTVDELVWFGGSAEHGLASLLSYGYARTQLTPYPFLGPCNADLQLDNYTTDKGTVGVWEWDINVGNFGLTVSHYEVYLDGPLVGVPVMTTFTDASNAPNAPTCGTDPDASSCGQSNGEAAFVMPSVVAVPAELFSGPELEHC